MYQSPPRQQPYQESTPFICIDYRGINAKTVINAYPIPCIENILDYLGGSIIFSKIYLAARYHRVQITKGYDYKTTFLMLFGLSNYHDLQFKLGNLPAIF